MGKLGEEKRKKIVLPAGALLAAYALTAEFHAPFTVNHFETVIDYAIASGYELLGEYNFSFLLIWGLCILFFSWMKEKKVRPAKPVPPVLPVLFSLFLLLGRSYQEMGNWGYCFGSPVNFFKFMLVLAGYSILLGGILNVFTLLLEKGIFTGTEGQKHFWSIHGFARAFVLLCAVYFPFLLLAYPGNICWDAAGQIEQVIGQSGYSRHHPLFHTLLAGGMTELGNRLWGSYEAGLFAYMLLQLAGLAAALASTIAVLAKRAVRKELLWALFLLYCITPVYSNMASTVLKDVPYASAVVGYIVCLSLIIEKPERLKSIRLAAGFAVLQACVILLRNNGVYVVLASGIAIFCVLLKQNGWKEAGRRFLGIFAGGAAAGILVMAGLAVVCDAQAGSRGEMLSIPFQQTARYLQLYGSEISVEEREAVEAVLGDVQELAGKYDPSTADPVKACFRRNASAGEILEYIKAWARGLIKHPGVYAEGFLAHIYGWLSPEISNSTRYEADHGLLRQGGLFPNAEKLLIFYYRFAARFTPVGVLENIGLAVWALAFLALYQIRHGQGRYGLAGIPLWVSLMVCMASPGFLGHARYGFPILFSIPFLYGFTMTAKEEKGVTD